MAVVSELIRCESVVLLVWILQFGDQVQTGQCESSGRLIQGKDFQGDHQTGAKWYVCI